MNNVIPKLSVLLRLLLVAPIYIVALVLLFHTEYSEVLQSLT